MALEKSREIFYNLNNGKIVKLMENETTKKDSIIMEIRAGAGGEEAALFAQDLFKMYSKFALINNWKCSILDVNRTELGGVKQIIFELRGENALTKMQMEGGVHRVQRVPQTEKNNRIHTSTVSVAVLLKPKETQIQIKPSDIKMDFYKSSGPGGQNVNKRQTAVRLTYLPTGLAVTSQVERNLEENKRAAMIILEAKLFAEKQKNLENKISEERKSQIGAAERAEKIRTYNFPQDRITDHRIEKTWHNIEKIMEGKMEKMIETLKKRLKD